MKYTVGCHSYSKDFNCLDCADNYFNELKVENKYLLDNYKNEILKNTYGW